MLGLAKDRISHQPPKHEQVKKELIIHSSLRGIKIDTKTFRGIPG